MILNLSYSVFIIHLWSHCPHHLEAFELLCYANWLIYLSLNDLDALIETYSFQLIYDLFILFINLFALCYICFFLLIILVLLFVVIDVVVLYLAFLLCILLFCRLTVLCCLCCHCVLEPYNLFAIITLYLFLLLFKLFRYC